MNDDNKIVNQNAPPITQANQVQPQASVQPVVPAESLNKETEPVGSPVSEFLKPTDAEPQINQELKDLGIEAKKDAPNITDEHRGIVDHAKQFTPVPLSPSGKVSLPMSEDEIVDKLKTGGNDDSGKWLAGLIKKVIAVMGL